MRDVLTSCEHLVPVVGGTVEPCGRKCIAGGGL